MKKYSHKCKIPAVTNVKREKKSHKCKIQKKKKTWNVKKWIIVGFYLDVQVTGTWMSYTWLFVYWAIRHCFNIMKMPYSMTILEYLVVRIPVCPVIVHHLILFIPRHAKSGGVLCHNYPICLSVRPSISASFPIPNLSIFDPPSSNFAWTLISGRSGIGLQMSNIRL